MSWRYFGGNGSLETIEGTIIFSTESNGILDIAVWNGGAMIFNWKFP